MKHNAHIIARLTNLIKGAASLVQLDSNDTEWPAMMAFILERHVDALHLEVGLFPAITEE